MLFRKSMLIINYLAFAIFSMEFVPIKSNELTRGVSDFAAEFYEVIHLPNLSAIISFHRFNFLSSFRLHCSNVSNRSLET